MNREPPPAYDLEAFFAQSLDLLCVATTDGRFVKINPSFGRVLGYPDEELLSRAFIEFVHPDDVESTLGALRDLAEGKATTDFRNRYARSDGRYRVLAWNARLDPITGYIYGIARDVTDEEQAKYELQQVLRALSTETIVARTDARGVITEVNDKFCEISGYDRDELIGRTHRIVNSGHHAPEFFADMWRRIARGETWAGLIVNRTKSGDLYYVQSVIAPILDLRREVQSYLAIRFDVTAAVHGQAELEKTLQILNETGAIAKVGGWELDVATGDLSWTDETFRILEVEKRDDRKPKLPEGLELFVEEHKPIIDDAVRRAMEFGEPYSLEIKARTAKGNVRWVFTNGRANYRDGRIVSLSGTIQDIQERKMTELRYEDERQKAIMNNKLASLGELAASVAHEINNPLSIISGAAELIEMQVGRAAECEEEFVNISRSVERIARIVKSLKKYSRVSERVERRPHVLRAVVQEALVMTEARARREGVTVELHSSTDATIDCDDIEIEQVVVNLVNNALDAVRTLATRWVRLEIADGEDGTLLLRVTDAGPGITRPMQERLFETFFTTKPAGVGTGLGLSISKRILDAHGASIGIANDHANTCFEIRFPRHAPPGAAS